MTTSISQGLSCCGNNVPVFKVANLSFYSSYFRVDIQHMWQLMIKWSGAGHALIITQKPQNKLYFTLFLCSVLSCGHIFKCQMSSVDISNHIRMRSSWTANDSKGCTWQQLIHEYISHSTSMSSFGFSKWSQLSNDLLNHVLARAGGILEGSTIPFNDIKGKPKMQLSASHRWA